MLLLSAISVGSPVEMFPSLNWIGCMFYQKSCWRKKEKCAAPTLYSISIFTPAQEILLFLLVSYPRAILVFCSFHCCSLSVPRDSLLFLFSSIDFSQFNLCSYNPWLLELMDHKNYANLKTNLLSRNHVSCWSRACPTGVFSSTIQINNPERKTCYVILLICYSLRFNKCFNHYNFFSSGESLPIRLPQ